MAGTCVYSVGGATLVANLHRWHVVYQGAIMRTKAAAELPATVRPQQHSMLQAPDVTSCFHAMGFERDYEVLKRGRCFSFAYHGIGMQVSLGVFYTAAFGVCF